MVRKFKRSKKRSYGDKVKQGKQMYGPGCCGNNREVKYKGPPGTPNHYPSTDEVNWNRATVR